MGFQVTNLTETNLFLTNLCLTMADTSGNTRGGGGGGVQPIYMTTLGLFCLEFHVISSLICSISRQKLGFQNTILMVHLVINHMLSIENQHFRENIYMIINI